MHVGTPIFDMVQTRMRSGFSISMNLDKKLIFLVMIISCTTLIITGGLSFTYADQILKERIADQLIGESAVHGETVRMLLESSIMHNNVLAGDPAIQALISQMNQASAEERNAIHKASETDFLVRVQAFEEHSGFSGKIDDVKAMGSDGTVFFSVAGTANGKSYSENQLFQRGLGGEELVEFEPVKTGHAGSSGKRMVIVSPIFSQDNSNEEKPVGVIISKVRTGVLDEILKNRSGLGDTGEVYIVNDRFELLSESRFVENAIFNVRVDTLGVQKCFSEGKEHLGPYPDYRGVLIYGSSYCAPDLGLVLLAEIDEAEVTGPITVLQEKILLLGVAITMAMGVAAFVISQSISRPLIKLKNAADMIASGDFGTRTNINSRDEIGQLSGAFDFMAQRLQGSLMEIREKDDVIRKQGDILLKFFQRPQNGCVGVVDMADSTKISAQLSEEDFSRMYEIFLNYMARIIQKYDGQVIKSIGDALLFRFPENETHDAKTIKSVIECCLHMIDSRKDLNDELSFAGLPELSYKISLTYGSVKVAQSAISNISDIFGPTVNQCFKINSHCPKNSVIVDINMYEHLGSSPEYGFTELDISEIKKKYGYIVFEVKRRPPAQTTPAMM